MNAVGTVLRDEGKRQGLAVDSGDVTADSENLWYNRAGRYLQNEADRAQKIAETAYARGTAGLNSTQRIFFDTGLAGLQVAGDLGYNWEIHNPVTKERVSELMYDAMIGGLLSGISGGTDIARTIRGNQRGVGNYSETEIEAIRYEGRTFKNLVVGVDSSVSAFFEKWRNGRKTMEVTTVYAKKSTASEVIADFSTNTRTPKASEPVLSDIISNFEQRVNVNNAESGSASAAERQALRGEASPLSIDRIAQKQGEIKGIYTPYSDAYHSNRYHELERKYLDGSISPEEADELWELERIRG